MTTHRLRFRRWLKAREFVSEIDILGYDWNPIRIHYEKGEKWYCLEFESAKPRKVIAKYYENVKDYKSYK